MEIVLRQKSNTFDQGQIQNIVAYSEILKRIHIRLVNEGYKIVNGEIIPPSGNKSDKI